MFFKTLLLAALSVASLDSMEVTRNRGENTDYLPSIVASHTDHSSRDARLYVENLLEESVFPEIKKGDLRSEFVKSDSKIITHGKWGEKVYYALTEDNLLVFWGKGKMGGKCGYPYRFDDCQSVPWDKHEVKHIVVQEGITSIGPGCFSGHHAIEDIVIPSSVTSIEEKAFFGCTNLKSITLPEKLTYIGESAFYSCNSLKKLIIPSSVSYIGYGACSFCDNLISIVIPKSLTDIGGSTFAHCENLVDVKYCGYSKVSNDNGAFFYGCDKLSAVKVKKDYPYNTFLGKNVTKILDDKCY